MEHRGGGSSSRAQVPTPSARVPQVGRLSGGRRGSGEARAFPTAKPAEILSTEQSNPLVGIVLQYCKEVVIAVHDPTQESPIHTCRQVARILTNFTDEIKNHFRKIDNKEFMPLGTKTSECVSLLKKFIIAAGLPDNLKGLFPIIPNMVSYTDNDRVAACGETIVKKSCKILKLLMRTDPKLKEKDPESKAFIIFRDVFMETEEFGGLMRVFNLNSSDQQLILPVGAKSIIKFITHAFTLSKSDFLLSDPKRVFAGGLVTIKQDGNKMLKDAHLLVKKLMGEVFYPYINVNDDDVGMQGIPRLESVLLFEALLFATPFTNFDAEISKQVCELSDDMFESQVTNGMLPYLSLLPTAALFMIGYASPSVMGFCRTELNLEQLNNFGRAYCLKNKIKFKRPLKHFLKNVESPPMISILYVVLTIMERRMEEGNNFEEYIDLACSGFLIKSWENMECLFYNYSFLFANSVDIVVEMAYILTKRLTSSQVQNKLRKAPPKEGIRYSAFGKCIQAIEHGIHCIEEVLSKGRDMKEYGYFIDQGGVKDMIRKVLDIGKTLDRIQSPYVSCSYLDALGQIGPNITSFLDANLTRELIKRVLSFRVSLDKPIANNAEDVAAKAGRAAGKLMKYPSRMITDVGSLNMIFREGFSQLEGKGGKTHQMNVRITWSWALAELTQSLGEAVAKKDYICSNDTYINLLKYASIIIMGANKGRYNGYRAAGNLFVYLSPQTHNSGEEMEVIFNACVDIIKIMTKQLGETLDYKVFPGSIKEYTIESCNRWNAAYGLGCVFENEDLTRFICNHDKNNYAGEIKEEIIKTLAKWSCKSQNYKERIQCLSSLAKINDRNVIGNLMESTVISICNGILHFPAEENELLGKLLLQTVLTLCSLLSLMDPSDATGPFLTNSIVPYADRLDQVFHQVEKELVDKQADMILKARDRLQAIHQSEKNVHVILPWLINRLSFHIVNVNTTIPKNEQDIAVLQEESMLDASIQRGIMDHGLTDYFVKDVID